MLTANAAPAIEREADPTSAGGVSWTTVAELAARLHGLELAVAAAGATLRVAPSMTAGNEAELRMVIAAALVACRP